MTVADLKEILKTYNDDAKVVGFLLAEREGGRTASVLAVDVQQPVRNL